MFKIAVQSADLERGLARLQDEDAAHSDASQVLRWNPHASPTRQTFTDSLLRPGVSVTWNRLSCLGTSKPGPSARISSKAGGPASSLSNTGSPLSWTSTLSSVLSPMISRSTAEVA